MVRRSMATVTVSEKGQVVIPAPIRHSLGIKPGSKLGFEMDGSTIRVRVEHAVPSSRIEQGYGMLRAKRSKRERRLSTFDPALELRKRGR